MYGTYGAAAGLPFPLMRTWHTPIMIVMGTVQLGAQYDTARRVLTTILAAYYMK